jgi:CheY-like chemotaxis protein
MSKVFIFDHNVDTQRSINGVLEEEGHEVRGSSDASIALKRIMAWVEQDGKGPDIILVEYFAPEGDPQYRGGEWLVEELKRSDFTRFIPIVIMCEVGRHKSVTELSEHFRRHYDAVAFLSKPFDLAKVRDAVNGILWAHSD